MIHATELFTRSGKLGGTLKGLERRETDEQDEAGKVSELNEVKAEHNSFAKNRQLSSLVAETDGTSPVESTARTADPPI